MPKNPLIGYVAANRSMYTMHYKREGNIGGISRRDYWPSAFSEANDDTPIVRFDLAPMNAPMYITITNEEYYDPIGARHVGNTKDEVAEWKRRGVPVQTYLEFKQGLEGENDGSDI